MIIMTREEARKKVQRSKKRKKLKHELECALCGRRFVGDKRQKFCSMACFRTSIRNRSICANPDCEERYISGNGYREWCSWECYKADIPRRMGEVEAKRREFEESYSGEVWSFVDKVVGEKHEQETERRKLRKKKADEQRLKEEDVARQFLDALMAISEFELRMSEDVPMLALELGRALGFREGECSIRAQEILLQLEKRTSFVRRMRHHTGLNGWLLTDRGWEVIT